MAGKGAGDLLVSLFDQALSGPSTMGTPTPAGGVTPWSGRPIGKGFSLESPVPDLMTEMNIVTLYKQLHYIMRQDQMSVGWSLCSDANALKKQIVANPAGVPRSVLEEYAGILALVREHVATNADPLHPYSYNGGKHTATDFDFELYMTLATLAARSSLEPGRYFAVR